MQLEQYAAWGSCPRTLWQTGELQLFLTGRQPTLHPEEHRHCLNNAGASQFLVDVFKYFEKNMFKNIALVSSQLHSVRWWVWCLHEQRIRTVEKLVNGKTKWWHQMEMSEGWAKISILFNIYNVEETNNNTWLKVYIFNSDSSKYTSRSQYA